MPSQLRLPLLENATEDTTGTSFNWYSKGNGTIQFLGVFDGAHVEIQGSADGDNDSSYMTVTGGLIYNTCITPIEGGQIDIRAKLVNAGTITDISVYAIPQSRE